MPEVVQLNHWEAGLDLRRDSRITDEGRLVVADNVYVGLGRQIRKRPGLTLVTTLESGTVGLMNGGSKLNTFYTTGTITHANTTFKANKTTHPSLLTQAIARANVGTIFNGFLYVVVEYANGDVFHHYLDGVTPSYIADANCPNTRSIIKMASKLFAVGKSPGDTVRFCSTANGARDWTLANDAGFIATGLRAEGDSQAFALAQFRKMLAVLMVDSVQVWQVDPNPANISIFQNVYGIGSKFPNAAMRMGSEQEPVARMAYEMVWSEI